MMRKKSNQSLSGENKFIAKIVFRIRVVLCLFRFVPFIRMAGLNGSVARGSWSEKSDVDLLIIARAGRLYTARFFATIIIHLTGWRRYGDKVAGRICLNCYLSDKNPNITPHDVKSRGKVARAYKYLIPLVDVSGTAREFFEVNRWMDGEWSVVSRQSSVAGMRQSVVSRQSSVVGMRQSVVSRQSSVVGMRQSVASRQSSVVAYNNSLHKKLIPNGSKKPVRFLEIYLGGIFGNWVEKKLMNYQVRRIMAGKKRGDEIIATKDEIRLHPSKNPKL